MLHTLKKIATRPIGRPSPAVMPPATPRKGKSQGNTTYDNVHLIPEITIEVEKVLLADSNSVSLEISRLIHQACHEKIIYGQNSD